MDVISNTQIMTYKNYHNSHKNRKALPSRSCLVDPYSRLIIKRLPLNFLQQWGLLREGSIN